MDTFLVSDLRQALYRIIMNEQPPFGNMYLAPAELQRAWSDGYAELRCCGTSGISEPVYEGLKKNTVLKGETQRADQVILNNQIDTIVRSL